MHAVQRFSGGGSKLRKTEAVRVRRTLAFGCTALHRVVGEWERLEGNRRGQGSRRGASSGAGTEDAAGWDGGSAGRRVFWPGCEVRMIPSSRMRAKASWASPLEMAWVTTATASSADLSRRAWADSRSSPFQGAIEEWRTRDRG